MARTEESDTIVLLDDELYNMTWMIDYLYSLNYLVNPATNANEALDLVQEKNFRAIILDLNVPILPPLEEAARAFGAVYVKYPGLFVARQARQQGYRGRQVILYSVHRDEEVTEEVRKLGCTYILKGRPKMIKDEIKAVLSYDPTDN
jgi:CheY-like chemotaxis protein